MKYSCLPFPLRQLQMQYSKWCQPVFADINLADANLDPNSVEKN